VNLTFVVGLFLSFFFTQAYAQVEGRLLSRSSSGQTAVFNLGINDRISEGDYAVIVKEIRDEGSNDLRVVPVAKARNIKTSLHHSIWILFHVYDQKFLKLGDKFSVFTDRNVLKGQVDPKVSQTTVITPPNEKSKIIKGYLREDHDRVAKKSDNYQVDTVIHDQEIISNSDFNLVDVDEWKKQNMIRYRSNIFKSSRPRDFKRSYNLEKFESFVAQYLKRVNDPNFNYEKFYADQKRYNGMNEFREKSHLMNEYENFLFEKSRISGLESKMYKNILDKGEAWSEDFSDEELGKLLNQISIVEEKERRERAASIPYHHSITLEYGKILTNAQSDNDVTYINKDLNFYGLDFEYFPFLKHQKFDKFAFTANPQITNSAFFATQRNVNLTHYSSTFGFNWYLNQTPYKIHSPLLFIGGFGRIGYAQAASPVTMDEAKYNLFSFPGLRTGVRMNFKNRISLRLVASIETLKLERYEANKVGTFLDQRYNLLESKLIFGLSYLY